MKDPFRVFGIGRTPLRTALGCGLALALLPGAAFGSEEATLGDDPYEVDAAVEVLEPPPVASPPTYLAPAERAPAAAADPGSELARVERATFTTGVVDREPNDRVTELSSDQGKVFYFTEILNAAGSTVTHQWSFNGEVVAEIPFEIGGPRWRAYSSKTLRTDWVGEWTATVIDESGRVLSTNTFAYTPAASPAPSSAVPASAAP